MSLKWCCKYLSTDGRELAGDRQYLAFRILKQELSFNVFSLFLKHAIPFTVVDTTNLRGDSEVCDRVNQMVV